MGIKHFRLGGMDFETDDEGMDDVEAVEAFLTETFETGFLDAETGVTYYMSNGSIAIEVDEDEPAGKSEAAEAVDRTYPSPT